MVKDPLYRKILGRLNEQGLVGDVFEACMAVLLREMFPGLVPVPGGNDAGMDGAIADGQGEPYPLVCTISGKVERNLSENLDSFINRGLSTRKVVFATSQKVTPKGRRRLHELARNKGFTLLQVVEQRAVATFLYRNPRCRQDFLDLPGNPSALSVIPLTQRPLMELEPVGRDTDRQWIRATQQDRLLLGQPGSGKTYLLHYEMLQGWDALFLVGRDEAAIADALREQKPKVVVIDDAHVEPHRIATLRRIGRDIGARFQIMAVTWEGGKDTVIEAMGGLPEPQVRTLELLTRDEVLQVIRQVGVEEHEDVMRGLVDQAARKPGLAVTIAVLFLQGAWKEALDGRALHRTLVTAFQELVGKDSASILASFALGGNAGMPLKAVGEVLGIGLADMVWKTSALAAGGVLSDLKDGRLSVWPLALRRALIRQTFFPDSGPGLPYDDLLERAPDRQQAVEAIVTARQYGASVPDPILRDLVCSTKSRRAWQELAVSSAENALWALREYPGNKIDVAEPALEVAPEAAIPILLEKATLDHGVPDTRDSHPMRILANWIREWNEHRPEEPMRRRKLLAQAVRRYLQEGGKASVGAQAIRAILSPVSESNRTDPGSGNTVKMIRVPMSLDEIRGLGKLWDSLRAPITELNQESWSHLSEALWGWIYPEASFRGAEVPEAYRTAMNGFAAKMLQDLSPLTKGSPGLAKEMSHLGAKIGIELEIESDPIYEILFPADYDGGDLQAWEASQLKPVEELALDWSRRDPQEVINRLLFYEQEAEKVRRKWPRWTPTICRELAHSADEPERWAANLMDGDAPGDLVEPFLKKSIEIHRPGWEPLVERCLSSERYVGFAISWLLEMKAPPQGLLEMALEKTPRFLQLVETLCLRNEVPTAQLLALLSHTDRTVALAAAVGEWLAEPKGTVREALLPAWRKAIADSAQLNHLEKSGVDHGLKEILAKDPTLAYAWLRDYFARSERPLQLFPEKIPERALSALSREQRLLLLKERADSSVIVNFLRQLVGRDLDIYRELLSMPDLFQHHLAPLGGLPDDVWLPFTMAALEAGHRAPEIVNATVPTGRGITPGPIERTWQDLDLAMSRFVDHENEGIREVAREGRRTAAHWIQVWQRKKLERERELDSY